MPGLIVCSSLTRAYGRFQTFQPLSHITRRACNTCHYLGNVSLKHAQPQRRAMAVNNIDNSFWMVSAQPVNSLIAVILNYHLPEQIDQVLKQAYFIICADGGANRLYDAFPQGDKTSGFLPAVIAGDMDSIRPDVQQHFTNHGSEIIDQSQDQDTTDLQKCLGQLEARFTKEKLASSTVVAAGGLGGRLDHVISALSTLHKWRHLHIILWGDGSTAQLLSPGKHIIKPAQAFEGPTCGLVPLNGPATLTTKGLKWNLTQTRLEFTGMISTSNHIIADTVEVETDADVIWMTEVMH